jgi:5-methylcytosine-specific restriction protein A
MGNLTKYESEFMGKKELNWNEVELTASVDAYFELQRRLDLGEKFVMKNAMEAIVKSALPHRNLGAVERRMSNISAVLIELGIPWCRRFKPLRNVGAKVKKILASRIMQISQGEAEPLLGALVEDDVPEDGPYTEGARRLTSHYAIERSAAAAEEAKELNRLENGGDYCCEVCGDKPGIRYGVRVIDAHHIRPISETEGKYLVRPQDFLIVCPNCHRAIHRLHDLDGDAVRRRLNGARPS